MGFSLAASEQAERTKGGNAPHSSKLPSERLTADPDADVWTTRWKPFSLYCAIKENFQLSTV